MGTYKHLSINERELIYLYNSMSFSVRNIGSCVNTPDKNSRIKELNQVHSILTFSKIDVSIPHLDKWVVLQSSKNNRLLQV